MSGSTVGDAVPASITACSWSSAGELSSSESMSWNEGTSIAEGNRRNLDRSLLHLMAINDLVTPFPVVDADPHAGRVMRYLRPSDYALWAAGTAAAPAALYGLRASRSRSRGAADPAQNSRTRQSSARRASDRRLSSPPG